MNVTLDRNFKKAANSEILTDTTLLASETQTTNRGLHHLSKSYHIADLDCNYRTGSGIYAVENVRSRSRGDGKATQDQS